MLEEVGGQRPRQARVLDDLDRRRRVARVNAEAAVARSLADPPGRRIDARVARGVLAAVRRQVIAAHTLRTRPLVESPEVTVPDLQSLAAGRGAVAEALRRARTDPPPPLRPLHDPFVERLRAGGLDPVARGLLEVETDELVDAANTLGHVLWTARAPDRIGGAGPPPEHR